MTAAGPENQTPASPGRERTGLPHSLKDTTVTKMGAPTSYHRLSGITLTTAMGPSGPSQVTIPLFYTPEDSWSRQDSHLWYEKRDCLYLCSGSDCDVWCLLWIYWKGNSSQVLSLCWLLIFYFRDSSLFLLIKRRLWVVLLSILWLHQWGNKKEMRNNLGEEKKKSPEPDTTGMVELEHFGPLM